MKLERQPDGTLRLGESLALLRWGCLFGALTVVTGAAAIVLGLVEARLAEREWLALGGVALACVAGALWAPTTEIEIEPGRRRIRWRRSRLVGVRQRSIPFDSVTGVEVIDQRSRHDDRRPTTTHRIVLSTAGEQIPLGVVDLHEREATALAQEIRRILGRASVAGDGGEPGGRGTERDVEARVRAHLAAGRRVEAVALVRAELGLSLEAADRWIREKVEPS